MISTMCWLQVGAETGGRANMVAASVLGGWLAAVVAAIAAHGVLLPLDAGFDSAANVHYMHVTCM